MNPDQYAKLKSASHRHAEAKGFADLSEDFTQSAALKLSQGRKAKVSQLFIDYLRETFGKTQRQNQDLKYKEARGYIEVHALEDQLEDPTQNPETDFNALLKSLSPRERAFIVLRYKWDLGLNEIGECFGVSESRICQELRETQAKLKKQITNGNQKAIGL